MSDAADSVAAMLRAGDRQRYLSTLFQPEPHRQAVQALFAFNSEVAAVRDRVMDPTAGEIRLRWWRDALTGTRHGDIERSQVASALFAALDRYSLPAAPLVRLIDARRFDLYDDPMPDLSSFEGYAGETASVLYHINAAMLAGGRFPEAGDAAGHLGVAHALIGHLAGFEANAARGRLFLPLDVFRAAGAGEGEVMAAPQSGPVRAGLSLLIDIAAEHLAKAAAAIAASEFGGRPAYVLLPVLHRQLEALRRGKGRAPADWQQLGAMAWWLLRQRQAPAM